MQEHHRHVVHQGADSGGLIELIFTVVGFVVAYLPFVLIACGTGYALFKYAHLSQFVAGIIGFLAGYGTLGAIRALHRLGDRLEKHYNRWHIPIQLMVALFVAGPPFALGYVLGSWIVMDRSLFERLIAGGFVGILLAGMAYSRVIEDDA
jgi:hypothetical protein